VEDFRGLAQKRLRRAINVSARVARCCARRMTCRGSRRLHNVSTEAQATLREFGELATWVVPTDSVCSCPNQDQVAAVIQRVAKQQFGAGSTRREFREALKAVEQFERRNSISPTT
jgi:hypothetical protein